MKKIVLSASLLMGTLPLLLAQTRAGAIAIGGTMGFATTNNKTETTANGVTTTTEGERSTSISFVPNISYFFSPKLAIGLGVGYRGASSQGPPQTDNSIGYTYRLKTSSSGVVINPYAKYYISLGEKAAFFLQGDVNVHIGSSKNEYYDNTDNVVREGEPGKAQAFGIGILPGILFFPSEKIGIELALGTPASIGNGGAYLLGFGHQTDRVTTYNGNARAEEKRKTNTISFLNLNSIGVGVSVFYFIK